MSVKLKVLLVCLFLGSSNFMNAQNTVGTTYNSSAVEEGYTLFEFMGDTTIYLIDNCGRVINQWESEFTAGTSVYLLEDGSIIRGGKTPTTHFPVGGQGGVLEKFDWDGNLTWQFFYSDSLQSLHHDFAVMPNGNILAIAFELISKQEAMDNGRDTLRLSDNKLWPEKIIEIQPQGINGATIVWEWRMWDHLIQNHDATKLNYGVVEEHPELFDLNFMTTTIADWAHANSLDYNPLLDQIALSLNFFNEFVILDHSTTTVEAASSAGGNSGKGGDILYRYGNPQSYGRGDSTNQVSYSQHDVHWIGEGLTDNGKIMFYNNGTDRPEGDYSSIDIITPWTDVNGSYMLEADTTFGPDNPEWTYVAEIPTDFFSPITSSAQRLPNGNTLICQGRSGRIFEINANQDLVWEYLSPINNIGILNQGDVPSGNRLIFKAKKYSSSFPGFTGRDLTPGLPIELNPNLNNCLSLDVADLVGPKIIVYPNPVYDYLTIEIENSSCNCLVEIFDVFGKSVFNEIYAAPINLSFLTNGVYYLLVEGKVIKIIKA